LVFEEVAI
jgi:hypothetical protein